MEISEIYNKFTKDPTRHLTRRKRVSQFLSLFIIFNYKGVKITGASELELSVGFVLLYGNG